MGQLHQLMSRKFDYDIPVANVFRAAMFQRESSYRWGRHHERTIILNRPLFGGDPEVRMLGYGKEQMWK